MTSTWAKAPSYAGDPARVEAVRTQTTADRNTYLEQGLQEVRCQSCGIEVLVRKNSYKHTSIQWQTDPATTCPEFAGSCGRTGTRRTCPRLQASVEHAVLEGVLEVRDPDRPDDAQ